MFLSQQQLHASRHPRPQHNGMWLVALTTFLTVLIIDLASVSGDEEGSFVLFRLACWHILEVPAKSYSRSNCIHARRHP